jgi:HEAT repeat protein
MADTISSRLAGRRQYRWWLAGVVAVLAAVVVIACFLQGRARVTGDTPEERAANIGRMVDEGKWGAGDAAAGAARDASPQVREAAVVALGRLGRHEELVRGALADPDPSVRYAAAVALGGSQDPKAADILGELALNEHDTKTRVGAVLGLGRTNTPRATCHIVQAMDVLDPEVARTAMEVLSAQVGLRWDIPPDPRDRREWVRKAELLKKSQFVRRAMADAGG